MVAALDWAALVLVEEAIEEAAALCEIAPAAAPPPAARGAPPPEFDAEDRPEDVTVPVDFETEARALGLR